MRYRLSLSSILAALCLSVAGNLESAKAGPSPTPAAVLPPNVEKFYIKTKSRDNPEVPFYVRVPKSYQPNGMSGQKLYRVFFTCPTINDDGWRSMNLDPGLLALADERGWFVVSVTFHVERPEIRDRTLCYYYPQEFSGQAVLDALDHIRQEYPIATVGLLLHGFSGGAQFVHRFAIWAPERVAAVVVNSSSWFDIPTPACKQVAWLVTIGESDPNFENTLDFVQKLKDMGALPVMRSYLGMTHERAANIPKLDVEFLKFYDDLTRIRMATELPLIPGPARAVLPAWEMPYIGDTQEWKYYKNSADNIEDVPDDSLIYLPSKAIADAWGATDTDVAHH